MTFKPAHKDTQHHAGQVVSDDQGQRTLSDYIRSIKRAEAFDAVALEKKITFEEWFRQSGWESWACGLDGGFPLSAIRGAWNAALKHGKGPSS